MKERRDFVDFIIHLVEKKNIFYVLFFCSAVAVYSLSYNSRNEFKVTFDIMVSQQSNFINFIEFENLLKKGLVVNSEKYTQPFRLATYDDYKSNVCNYVQLSWVEPEFIKTLIDEFKKSRQIKSSSLIDYTDIELGDVIKSSIDFKSSGSCTKVTISGDIGWVSFIRDNYIRNLNNFMIDEFTKTLFLIRDKRVFVLRSLLRGDASDNEIKIIDLLNVSPEIGNNLLIHHSKSQVTGIIPNAFLVLFTVFISIFLYILILIGFDFRMQFNCRKNNVTSGRNVP
jgi:hypothetical protein